MSVRSPALGGPETRLPPPERPADPSPPSGSLTSPLRSAGYVAVLTALAFIQDAGLMVADTKFDLLVAPGRFLQRACSCGTPRRLRAGAEPGYGYPWPMGPFFAARHLARMPPWIDPAAVVGPAALCRVLRHGPPGRAAEHRQPCARIVAGVRVRALAPPDHASSGPISVEAWPRRSPPGCCCRWSRGSKEGSVRRAVPLSRARRRAAPAESTRPRSRPSSRSA